MRKLIVCLLLSLVLTSANCIEAGAKDTWISDEIQMYCEDIGMEYGICPELLMAIIEKESSGQADAYNPYGCYGLMQIHKASHAPRMAKLGVTDLTDAKQNILVGCDYLLELFEEHEDMYTVLKIYGGWSGDDGDKYINSVIARTRELEILHGKVEAKG